MASQIALRAPRDAAASKNEDSPFPPPPSIAWLEGAWYVTHSNLDLWKDKRNVRIEYTACDPSSSNLPRMDDVVFYQTKTSDKQKSIVGVDTVSVADDTGVFDWRGSGWLKIASSHWEVLGWGEETSADEAGDVKSQWAVTFFSKTLFSPEGVDIYSRRKEGLRPETVEEIKRILTSLDHPRIKTLAEALVEVLQN